MFIAFIGAMDVEVDSMIKALENVKKEEYRGYTFHIGERGNNKVVVSTCGVGKVNAAVASTIILDKYHVDYVINSGIAGSVDTKIGSTVIANEVQYFDFIVPGYNYGVPRQPNSYKPSDSLIQSVKEILGGSVIYGKVVSGDRFVTSLSDFGLYDYKNTVAVDMESASIAQVCYLFSTDFLIIRSISDNLSMDDCENNATMTSTKSYEIALKVIDNYNKYQK